MKIDYDWLLKEVRSARKRVSGYSKQKRAKLLAKAKAQIKKSHKK